MNCDVWLNGHHLGNYPYGYSFYYDLTPYFVQGENIIAVRVDKSRLILRRLFNEDKLSNKLILYKLYTPTLLILYYILKLIQLFYYQKNLCNCPI